MFHSIEYSEAQSLGKRVCFQGNKYGTLQYFGPTHFAEGLWCGLELDEAVGENDGLVDDFRYFTCKNKFGLFVPASETSIVNKSENTEYLDTSITDKLNASNISHLHDSYNFNPTSPEKSERIILNESYTISFGLHQRNKLSLIAEENIEAINCSDSLNASYSIFASTNNYGNISANRTFLQQPQSRKKTSNSQISEVPAHEIKYSENDLVDSDESLGILPSTILEDLQWDNLVSDVENTNDNLNVTMNLTHNIAEDLTDSNKIAFNFELEEPASVVCNMLDVSSGESPALKDASFSIYASTPKHETNFSDISEKIENALNLTHNLTTEIIVDHNPFISASYDKNIFETTTDIDAFKDMNDMADKCLNVTYSAENKDISEKNTRKLENKSRNGCEFQDNILPKETEKILNTTFEKVLEIPSDNINAQICHSKISTESIKENINFIKDESISKFQISKHRKSVGCLSSTNVLKGGINIKNIRRNSVSCNSDTSGNNVSKNKVTQLTFSKVSSYKNSLQKISFTNSVPSKENSVNSKSVKNRNKNSLDHQSMRTKYPDYKNKYNSTPKSELSSNQHCLNETINVKNLISEVGKTVVKKPRNSVLPFSTRNSTDHLDSFLPSRNRSKTTINKIAMPSKWERHTVSSIAVKTKVSEKVNETVSSVGTTFKLSAGTLDEKAVRKSRLLDKRLSAQNNTTSGSSCSGLIKPRSISALKEKKIGYNNNNDINKIVKFKNPSEKCKVEKVKPKETVLVSEQHSNSPPIEGIKHSNIKKSRCIPQSRIPFITGSKIAAQFKCIDVNLSSTSEDKYNEKEKPSHRMILRSASSANRIKRQSS